MMRGLSLAGLAMIAALPVAAQNYGSAGESWATTWGFASAADRTLMLQQAQAIRSAAQAQNTGPTTVVTNYNTTDNRQNYQEVAGGAGGLGAIDFQLNGDRIGQNTNTVGSMNTGTTNVDITGSGNSVDAINSADSEGCLDGSIAMSDNQISSLATPGALNFSLAEAVRSLDCGMQ